MAESTTSAPAAGSSGTQVTSVVVLQAPLSGQLVPIEHVPDPVFAEKMVGEGLSIDPLSDRLLAPCDGEVVQVHAAGHAVTMKTVEGLEVLLHIGLDTVGLKGEGFDPKVSVGEQVTAGTELITFDLDHVATHAKSVLTQMVITNPERLASFTPRSGLVTAGEDAVAELELVADDGRDDADAAAGRQVTSEAVIVANPVGLHARPAAVLVNLAKRFEGRVYLQRGDTRVNAKSVVAIMGLEVGPGEKVHLIAQGPEAAEAVETLSAAVAEGLGEAGAAPVAAPASSTVRAEPAPEPSVQSDDPDLLLGVAASPGLGVGTVLQIRHEDISVEEEATDRHHERRRLDDAIDKAQVQLEALEARLLREADPSKAAIFAAHQELLDDPDLLDLAGSAIDKGKSAAFAWRSAYRTHAERLAGLQSEVLAGRANDVRDVGQRVLEVLTGVRQERPEFPAGTILIAEDLTPSDTATLDRDRIEGFCTTSGGASSHVAILARSLDIPAVAGIDPQALEVAEGERVILDGAKGTLRLNASEAEVDRIRRRKERIAKRRAVELEHALEPAITTDGHRTEVVANIAAVEDAREAKSAGAEGVGLLRTEFAFMGRTSAPTEDEQVEIYRGIAEAMPEGQPLVIRTLDVGGDKPLSYLPIAREDNPFLGERGIRVGLDRPEILRTQARAILRAADAGARMHVMFPMIATMQDWRSAKEVFEEERLRLGADRIPVGIMVEVPSVAVIAERFAAEVDFFSVGSNDLTQYVLAMDRGHPKLAPQVDGLHPACLRLIGQSVKAAHEHGRWLGVCGSIAGDPQAVPLLLGLGVDELSVSIPAIPSVKAQIRRLSLEECRDLAAQALEQESAASVRALVPQDEDERGLEDEA